MKRQRIQRPTLVEVHHAFYLIDAVFNDLKGGEISVSDDGPVFKDELDGRWYPICDALAGWVDIWARLVRRYNLTINLAPLLQIENALRTDAEITPELVDACLAVIEQCRRAYRGMDMQVVKSIRKTTLIAIEAEDAGLVERAAA